MRCKGPAGCHATPDMERVIGLEPTTFSLGSCKPTSEGVVGKGVTRDSSSALADSPAVPSERDEELIEIACAWDGLNDRVRAGILAMVRAATKKSVPED